MIHYSAEIAAISAAAGDGFLDEVLRGLAHEQKSLPSRYFYDAEGSKLFETITELPEYYPTRTEIALLKTHAEEITALIPPGAAVVEFGSGSSRKTELLLHALKRPSAYIPMEISASALYPAAARIKQAFPSLEVYPILGGFDNPGSLKLPLTEVFCLGFFPGSTIGNFTNAEAAAFLRNSRLLLGADAAFLVGVDLKKPLNILLPAYNDEAKITAAFNLNILARINRELQGSFDLGMFEHQAIYNESESRIEMYLRSLCAQDVSVAGRIFNFKAGETIHTENSHKYTLAGFKDLAVEAGWQPLKAWVDCDDLFSVHLLA